MTKVRRHCSVCGRMMPAGEGGWIRVSPVSKGRPGEAGTAYVCPSCSGIVVPSQAGTVGDELVRAWAAANAVHPLEARGHLERAMRLLGVGVPDAERRDFS